MTKRELLEQTFKSKFELSQYKKFTVEFFNDAKLLNGEKRNDYWNWNEYSFYINGYYHVADYMDEKRNKIAIFAVELKKGKSLEKARSKQRNFIADRIKVMGYDGAIAAFYSEDENENRWRLSFVRLDYELLKGKIKTNFTPAKRYSYLLGVDEPCHTAMSQLYPILEEENFNPSIDKLEEAFSVEKVTKQFFEKYKEKYIELYEYLTQNETFRDEAMRCVKSDSEDDVFKFTEQFAKKLMGQVVFMYFLQKKGWLGVNAFPPQITEREIKNAFYDSNAEHKELLKQFYVLGEDGTYVRQAKIINSLSDEDQTYFAARIKGMPWETGPKDFVRKLFKEAVKHNRNYFEYYLEPLFYEALNEKREANNFYARLHCRIPFLNGGLFEPLDGYDWRHNNFSIPNEIFSNASIKGDREADGILDIFDRYNFTMNEDEPLEKEVAVDPEMLGKIFENLLDVKDRKSKGAFYTPREIVHYMCQESLINYIVNTVGTPYEDTKDFILYGEIMKDEDCSREVKSGAVDMLMPDSIYKNLKAIDDALADVRVADPAVGSGAFPMGMVNEIVKARENITAYFAREATAAQARQLWNYTRHPYMLKKDAMKNSIFAVDIEPSAVDITKLRLWLSLVVEFDINSENEEFRTPPTLPNLECNILCGNSLIDEFEGIKLFNDSLLTGASNNGNWMADLFQDQVDKTLEKLIEKQRELFYANNHDDKYRLKHEIDVLQQQVIFSSCTMTDDVKERVTSAFAMPSKPFILWKLTFAKVFKDKGGFDIIIGNPPYLYLSKSEYNVDAYRYETDGKTRLKERNPKGLNDDYVKFMRFAEKHIAEKGKGILAFITNSGYLDNPTFRGLRASLLRTYDDIYMLNLHGNSIKREVAPDGSKDENVFDIRIGVAIMIAIKTTSNGEWGHAYYSEVYGLREKKFEYLRKGEFNFKLIGLDKHTALFIPQEDNNKIEYDQGISLEELFDLTSTGIDSGNDDVTIKRYKSELESTVDNIKQASCEEDIIRIMGKMCSGQTPTRILKDILSEQGKITPISYRPFDNRYTYYSGMSCGWLSRPRDKQIMMSIVNITNNVALVYQKQSNKKWTDIFVADNIIDAHLIGSKSYVAPLYINKEGLIAPLVNLNADKLKELTQYLLDLPTPMDVFAYCYGVLYSKRYRELYDSFLKQDTPKIPIPNNQESFDKYVIAGKRLTSLHLMQSDICANINLERIDSDNLCIEQVKYLEGKLYINKHVFISGISQSVWNYYIGGYQVLDKWLKSLKGEILDGERFCHFKKMVAIIEETINIQENI